MHVCLWILLTTPKRGLKSGSTEASRQRNRKHREIGTIKKLKDMLQKRLKSDKASAVV